jgi:transcriptional regulator with GAF, ATPase, and Fis domain
LALWGRAESRVDKSGIGQTNLFHFLEETTMMTAAEREDERKSIARVKTLYEIVKTLNSSLELKETFPRILSILSQQMGMKRGGLLILNAESNEWEVEGTCGLSADEMKKRKDYFGSEVTQKILEKGLMAAVVDGGESIWLFDGKAKPAVKRSTISFFCSPIRIQSAIVGILGVDRFFEEPMPVTEDFNLLGEVCATFGETIRVRKEIMAENRVLLEENWSFRKELEDLGQNVPKARRRISLTEILEERLSRMIAEMKVDPRSNGNLYEDVLNVVERTLLKSALEKTKHVQLKTARFLGINRNTLRRKMKELGIPVKEK